MLATYRLAYWHDRDDLPGAIEESRAQLERLESAPQAHASDLAYARESLGVLFWLHGDYARAEDYLRQAIAAYRIAHQPIEAEFAYGNLGLVYWSAGQLYKAEDAYKRAIEMAEMIHASRRLVPETGNLGLVYLSAGRLDEAETHLRDQIARARQLNMSNEVRRGQGNLGVVFLHQGKYADAEYLISQDCLFWEANEVTDALVTTQINLAQCWLKQGRRGDGEALTRQALLTARQLNNKPLLIIALRGLAAFLNGSERRDCLFQALKLAENYRLLDAAAIQLSLAGTFADQTERDHWWLRGNALLHEIGASSWPSQHHSLDHPPFIPLMC
jgi:tetratricopeptide (TPR) repeat protein